MPATILVTGATGNVGSEVLKRLRDHDVRVIAAVPKPDRARRVLGSDVEVVAFDFGNPATFAPAFRNVDKLFLIRPPAISDVPRYITPALNAAQQAGVDQIVFLSLLGVERNSIVPHHAIEEAVRATGVPWTFLRPSFFMQNLNTTHRAEIRDNSEIFVPAGNGKTSFIDVRDIAAVGAKALLEDGHEQQAYPLTGSAALSYSEVAAIMSDVLHRPIRYRPPSLLAFAVRWRARGLPLDQIAVMAGISTLR